MRQDHDPLKRAKERRPYARRIQQPSTMLKKLVNPRHNKHDEQESGKPKDTVVEAFMTCGAIFLPRSKRQLLHGELLPLFGSDSAHVATSRCHMLTLEKPTRIVQEEISEAQAASLR